jgi:hypothetical protein
MARAKKANAKFAKKLLDEAMLSVKKEYPQIVEILNA